MSETQEFNEGDWEELQQLDREQPITGKITVLPGGNIASSVNGQIATVFSFNKVGSRARITYKVNGDEKIKSPRITKLEKGPDGSYRFHCSDGVFLFEPV